MQTQRVQEALQHIHGQQHRSGGSEPGSEGDEGHDRASAQHTVLHDQLLPEHVGQFGVRCSEQEKDPIIQTSTSSVIDTDAAEQNPL